MQQFTVPQFIDVEDKIIGPITARQFVIMLASFLLIVLFYKLLNFTTFLFFGITTFGVSGIISFFKINGMPFHFFILNFVKTSRRAALRVWNNDYIMDLITEDPEDSVVNDLLAPSHKPYNASHLTELALIVDTQGAYKGGDNEKKIELGDGFINEEKLNK